MFEPIFSYFGELLGVALGAVVLILAWWLLSYLFWGLIWSRIITKAGYRGEKRKLLIRTIYWPTLFAPGPVIVFRDIPELLAVFSVAMTIPQWIAIYYVCFSKWPVQGGPPKEAAPKTTK
jgi:hypothetical protein